MSALKNIKLKHAIWTALASTTLLVACGGGSGGGEPEPKKDLVPTKAEAKLPATKNTVSVQLIELATGQPIQDKLTITASSKATLIDANGKKVNDKKTSVEAGIFTVGVNYASGKEDVVVFAENAQKGWISNSVKLAANTTAPVTLYLTKVDANTKQAVNNNKKKGVAVEFKTANNFNNAIVVETPAKTVNVDAKSVPVGVTKMEVPANIKALDPKTNKAIAVKGPIKVSTVRYAPTDAETLSAFPGGFALSPQEVSTSNGNAQDGADFITGGFTQFNITDADGNKLTKFDKPIKASIDLVKGYKNPQGKELKAGDTFPVWSYDNDTAKWKFEKNGKVQEKTPVDPNFYQVVFETDHLSWWNLDYYGNRCPNNVASLTIQGRTDSRPLNIKLTGSNSANTGSYNYFNRTIWNITDSNVTLNNAPGFPVKVEVYDQGVKIGEQDNVNLCSGGTITIAPQPRASVTATVTSTEACSDGSNQRTLPAWVWAYDNNWRFLGWQRIDANNPTWSLDVFGPSPVSQTLRVYLWSPQGRQRQVVTVNSNQTNIPFTRTMPCAVTTGGTQAPN